MAAAKILTNALRKDFLEDIAGIQTKNAAHRNKLWGEYRKIYKDFESNIDGFALDSAKKRSLWDEFRSDYGTWGGQTPGPKMVDRRMSKTEATLASQLPVKDDRLIAKIGQEVKNTLLGPKADSPAMKELFDARTTGFDLSNSQRDHLWKEMNVNTGRRKVAEGLRSAGVLEKTDNNLLNLGTGYKISSKAQWSIGAGLAVGGTALGVGAGAFENKKMQDWGFGKNYNMMVDGQMLTGGPLTPFKRSQSQGYDLGAKGDMVFALHNRRHG